MHEVEGGYLKTIGSFVIKWGPHLVSVCRTGQLLLWWDSYEATYADILFMNALNWFPNVFSGVYRIIIKS